MATRVRPRSARSSVRPRKLTSRSTATGTSAAERTPPPPYIQVFQPARDAVALFQQGMTLLQRHDYRGAAESFRALLDDHPAEDALLDRARVYLGICERETRSTSPSPRTVEERVTAATAALNNGDESSAARLSRSVLKEVPNHELALYLLAAVAARQGARDSALSFLDQAVSASPEVRAQARYDPDFDGLRQLDAFQRLMVPPPPMESGTARHQRKSRSAR